jgi:hypothetical protein
VGEDRGTGKEVGGMKKLAVPPRWDLLFAPIGSWQFARCCYFPEFTIFTSKITIQMEHKNPSKSQPTWAARRIGYVIAIVILFALMYVFENLYEWGVPYITEDYNGLIKYIHISFYASIIIHIIFLAYDPKWFRHLLKGIANIFSALMVIMFYVVFPFDFPGNWNRIGRIILLVIMIISIISIITELYKAVRDMVRDDGD